MDDFRTEFIQDNLDLIPTSFDFGFSSPLFALGFFFQHSLPHVFLSFLFQFSTLLSQNSLTGFFLLLTFSHLFSKLFLFLLPLQFLDLLLELAFQCSRGTFTSHAAGVDYH